MSITNRPPIIAIVGHIDHGKSALQKAIRESETTLFEVGDITQHIGAYELHADHEGYARRATILDTPGHEAFSHIREHGVELADLALLVVSAEEGWKQQTKESYTTIQKLELPFIVVFTKIDTEKSELERAKNTLLHEGVYLEGLGGSIPWVAVSSKQGTGIKDLVELIFLTSDIYEITENRKDGSVGVLVEADIDPKMGIAGTIIVLQETLEEKKFIRIGGSVAPLRLMENDRKIRIKKAEPSTPVRIIGFDSLPHIGKSVFLYDSKKEALAAAKKESEAEDVEVHTEQELTNAKKIVPLILRSDTVSSLHSISRVLFESGNKGVYFKVIKKGVGAVSEEDVRMGIAEENCVVLGFHTEIDSTIRNLAEKNNTELLLFDTIYEVIDWIDSILIEKKDEYQLENITGEATIIRMFEEEKNAGRYIVGAQIVSGEFSVGQEVLVRRDKKEIGRLQIKKIEQKNTFKDSVSEKKTQFAAQLTGIGEITLQDTLVGLPDVQTE